MSISYEVTATLRAQEHGHPPLVMDESVVLATHQNQVGEAQVADTADTVGTSQNASARQAALILGARGADNDDDLH